MKFERKRLGDYVIPVIVIIIFILLIIFIFIPMFNRALDEYVAYRNWQTKYIEVVAYRTQLYRINPTQLELDNTAAQTVIPVSLKVTDFTFFVDALATQKSLKINEISSTNVDNSRTTPGNYVNSPLEYSGKLADIVSFLNDLQQSSPYIVSIALIDLEKNNVTAGAETTWSLRIDLNGHYLANSTREGSSRVDLANPLRPYVNDPKIIELFNSKYRQINTTLQQAN